MSENLPVRGTILSSSPCSVKDAAALLGSFLQCDTVPETGLLRGYLESVSGALEELASRAPPLKRKGKKSRKHGELDHKSAVDFQEDEARAGLNAEAVNSEAEQENGFKNGSRKRKKKADRDDADGNERVVKKRKSHSKQEDGGVNVENDDGRSSEKPLSKKRKNRGVDVESNDIRSTKKLHLAE